MSWLNNLIGLSSERGRSGLINAPTSPVNSRVIDDRPKKTSLPAKRSSSPSPGTGAYGNVMGGDKFRFPSCLPQIVPVIRRLMMTNPDVSQAMWNIAMIGNTGHKIVFDRKVSPEQVDLMRNHLINRRKTWASGQAGMNGLITKMFYQVLVGGAVSNEWVPNLSLTGIEGCVFVNPEDIHWEPNDRGTGYLPYQKAYDLNIGSDGITPKATKVDRTYGMIKLNPNTYKYYALGGDTDLPYGIPPYIPVLPRIDTQSNMNTSIDFVVDEFGLMGILEALITKPDQDFEIYPNDATFGSYLENLLDKAKQRLDGGMKDGVIVGFKDDHEFKFSSIGKDFGHAVELFKNNQLSLHSAIKHDPSLLGQSQSTSETQMGIVFIKMLSELKNIQNLVGTNLEFAYSLELMLAGFQFDSLSVMFNRSTLQDDLKYQQAQEIKIRNVKDKMIMGLINQDQAADELDLEASAYPEPMVPWEVLAGGSVPNTNDGAAADKASKGKKTDNAKKNRQKIKPVAKPNK